MSHSQVSDNAIIQVMKKYKENFKIFTLLWFRLYEYHTFKLIKLDLLVGKNSYFLKQW